MSRFTYLIAKVVIFFLLGLILWMGSKPLIRQVVKGYIHDQTGSRIELGEVASNLATGNLYIKNLSISDPENPEIKKIQSETINLEFDLGQFLHRRWHIRNGVVTGLVIDTPRTSSVNASETTVILDHQSSQNNGQDWLGQVGMMAAEVVSGNDLLEVQADALEKKWSAVIAAANDQTLNTESELATTNSNLKSTFANPLRDEQKIAASIRLLHDLQIRLAEARQQLQNFAETGRHEINDLLTQSNANSAEEVLAKTSFSIPDKLSTQLLFSGPAVEHTRQVLNWVKCLQEIIPAGTERVKLSSPLGKDIVFRGQVAQPELLIHDLKFNGEGIVDGYPLEFAGNIQNFSTQPELLATPMVVSLRAQGDQHFAAKAIFDRRSHQARERFVISCPDLKVGPQSLGQENVLKADAIGGSIQTEVDLMINGDSISGTIHLAHSGMAIRVASINDQAGGEAIKKLANKELMPIHSYEMTLRLSGTTTDPIVNLESSFGREFSSAIANSYKRHREIMLLELKPLLAKKQSEVSVRLEAALAEKVESIESLMNRQLRIARQIESLIPDSDFNTTKIR